MAEKLTQKDFKTFEKVYGDMLAEAEKLREDAVGILDPAMLKDTKITKLEKARKNLVLAYGRGGETREYSPDDLRRFLKAKQKVETRFESGMDGVPLGELIRASRKADILASKEVRSATLYKVAGNLLSFRVAATGTTPGVSHHQVQVRLEDWNRAMHANTGFVQGARAAATGRVSFDCSCGRHQYWYRYIATIGGFALDPQEQGFPKIRNRTLTGCCCKHVLKALGSLKSGGLHLQLAKEMERQAKAKGFSSSKNRYLAAPELQAVTAAVATAKDVRAAQIARREVLAKMHKALTQHKAAADALTKTQKPRSKKPVAPPSTLQKNGEGVSTAQRKILIGGINDARRMAQKYGINLNTQLDSLAEGMQVSRAALDAVAREEGLL